MSVSKFLCAVTCPLCFEDGAELPALGSEFLERVFGWRTRPPPPPPTGCWRHTGTRGPGRSSARLGGSLRPEVITGLSFAFRPKEVQSVFLACVWAPAAFPSAPDNKLRRKECKLQRQMCLSFRGRQARHSPLGPRVALRGRGKRMLFKYVFASHWLLLFGGENLLIINQTTSRRGWGAGRRSLHVSCVYRSA